MTEEDYIAQIDAKIGRVLWWVKWLAVVILPALLAWCLW